MQSSRGPRVSTDLVMSEQTAGVQRRGILVPRSYFNLLSEDILRNLLFLVSGRPRHANWLARMKPADALSILCAGESLGIVLRQEVCGAGLIVRPFFKADKFYEKCRGLKSLRLRSCEPHEHLLSILETCSGKLQSLDIEGAFIGAKTISSIASHCSGLKRLRLVACIERRLIEVWKTVGATLEYLCFRPPKIPHTEWAHEIPSFCSKLTTIELTRTHAVLGSVVQMLHQLGKQLKHVILLTPCAYVPPQDLLTACPFALFDVYAKSYASDTLQVLGPRLRSLRTKFKRDGDLLVDFTSCSNLEELLVTTTGYIGGPSLFDHLFVAPKLKLRVLKVDGLWSISILDRITRHVASIEEFSCRLDTRYYHTFENFALQNPFLRLVYVYFKAGRPDNDMRAAEQVLAMIDYFTQCPVLKQLEIDFVNQKLEPKRVALACGPFRGRCVDILVNGAHYGNERGTRKRSFGMRPVSRAICGYIC